MWIVEVIPIKKGPLQETLTYFSSDEVNHGALVTVPVRSKNIDAVVVSVRDARDEKAAIKNGDFKLRKIQRVKKPNTIPEYIFSSAALASKYYRRNKGEILDYLVPDFSVYSVYPEAFSYELEKSDVIPERLVLQAPMNERLAYYRTYIREAFAKKESIIFVAPSILDCEILARELSRGISDFVIILHSELGKKKISAAIKKLAEEKHSVVVIATPSYASLLRKDIHTLIVENESKSVYITPSNPPIDFRTLLEIMARTSGKKFILADTLLRVETLGRKDLGEFRSINTVSFRDEDPSIVQIINHGIPEELPTRLRSEQVPAFSEIALSALSKTVEKKTHIFAFSLRTGLSTFTRCRDCGKVLLCEYCQTPLVLYSGKTERPLYICNKCKRHRPSDGKCDRCGSWNMSAMGTGTEFVEAEIKRLYPNLPTFRIDRESTPTRKEAQKVIEQYKTAEAAVLIGTEMAMYYLEEADHSIIVAFDTLFNIPSYKSGERILNFYITIRERTKGKILIQTKNADDPILDVIRFGNYASWYKNELSEREEYGYPPYNTIMKISWYGKDEEREAAKAYIGEILENFNPDIFDSTVIRKGKREACTNAIIRPKREDWSLSVLLEGKNFSEVLREKLAKLPEDVIIAINPENLL